MTDSQIIGLVIGWSIITFIFGMIVGIYAERRISK